MKISSPAGSLATFSRDELLHEVAGARYIVRLASPYLSEPIAAELAAAARASAVDEPRLLTAVTPRAVAAGALSARGLVTALRAGFHVRSIPNLHAKVSLVDERWGIVGSGNLTTAGLGAAATQRGNLELGVRLTRQQIAVASGLFDGWWLHPSAADVTEEALAPFLALEPTKAGRFPVKPLGKPIDLPPAAPPPSQATTQGLWVKAMYQGGKASGEWWLQRSWIHDRHRERNGVMQRRPSYKVGDLIALYVVGPSRVPAILQVSMEPYDGRKQVAALYGPKDAALYGWVTPVEVVRSVPLAQAPGLDMLGVTAQGLQNGRVRVGSRAGFSALEAALIPVAAT